MASVPILHPSLSRRRLTLADAVGRLRPSRPKLVGHCLRVLQQPYGRRLRKPSPSSFSTFGGDNLDTGCFLRRMTRDPRAAARRLVCVRLRKRRVWTRKRSSSLTRTMPLGPFLRCCGRSLGASEGRLLLRGSMQVCKLVSTSHYHTESSRRIVLLPPQSLTV